MEERLPSTHKALGSALGLILELRKVGGGEIRRRGAWHSAPTISSASQPPAKGREPSGL